MVVATGASSRYFRALANLVGSIHHWAPGTTIAVFDLGLAPAERERIGGWCDCRLHWAPDGPPRNVLLDGRRLRRPHLAIPGLYAWKPLAIRQAVDEYRRVLWLDAGSDARGPLDPIERALETDGHFLARGQDLDMTERLHPGCARRMGRTVADFAGRPSYAANTQGYERGAEADSRILDPMLAAALDRRTIAPIGATVLGHRFDQSLLSIIAYTSGLAIRDRTDLVAAHRHEVELDPRRASARRIYTARATSSDYTLCLRSR
ncbi:MAG: hypothetical protein U1F51_21155 [Burkholderiales bacterium]